MADKEPTGERRVYVLDTEQLDRIRAYQADYGISSEVEAVRRLLDTALQMRDSASDILKKLKTKYAEEKDLRVLAREILAGHILVSSVHFEDDGVWFYMKGSERGKIARDGTIYLGYGPEDEGWREQTIARAKGGSLSWDAPKGGDLDDEIPF